ncbi:unnamed protein product [Boreogadus saida]
MERMRILPLVLLGLLRPSMGTVFPWTQPCETDYVELNALHEELKSYGFTVLGFPCNIFGKQEPGNNDEILPGIKHVRPGKGFVPTFPLFELGDVNGDQEQPVYTFLKSSCPPVGDNLGPASERLFWEPLKLSDIKWNFEKFLVGPDGKPVRRWFAKVDVSVVRRFIIEYLRRLPGQRDLINPLLES